MDNSISKVHKNYHYRHVTFRMISGMIVFIVTIAAIIVSINADVFKQHDNPFIESNDFTSPDRVLKFSENQLKRSNEKETQEIEIHPSSDTVDYFFMIDGTGSAMDYSNSNIKANVRDKLYRTGLFKDHRIANSSGLEPLNIESMVAFLLIGTIPVKICGDITLQLIRGSEPNKNIFTYRNLNNELNSNFLNAYREDEQKFIEEDHKKSYFNIFLNNQDLLGAIAESVDRSNSLIITVISDFIHEQNDSLKMTMEYSLGKLKERVETGGKDIKINLVRIRPDKKYYGSHSPDTKKRNINRLIIERMKQVSYCYSVEMEHLVADNSILHQTVTPTTFLTEKAGKGPVDLFLYSPRESVGAAWRHKVSAYENYYKVAGGKYTITNLSPLETFIAFNSSNKTQLVSLDSGEIKSMTLPDSIVLYQYDRLPSDYKYSKLDLFSEKVGTTNRFHLWQVDALTKSGATYYFICVFVTITLILSLVILIVFSMIPYEKEWKIILEFPLSILLSSLTIYFYFEHESFLILGKLSWIYYVFVGMILIVGTMLHYHWYLVFLQRDRLYEKFRLALEKDDLPRSG